MERIEEDVPPEETQGSLAHARKSARTPVASSACYLSRHHTVAGSETGRILTKPLHLPGGSDHLTLNADAAAGGIAVQLLVEGKPLEGYAFDDCGPVCADAVSIPVRWGATPALPGGGAPVQIEFRLRDAQLFSFSFRQGVQ